MSSKPWIHTTGRSTDRAALAVRIRGLRRRIADLERNEQAASGVWSALRENELRLRQLAENLEDVFWVTEAGTGRMLYVSPSYERVWGRTCQSLYEHSEEWIEAIHPDDRVDAIAQFFQQDLENYHFDQTYRVVLPDGSIRWIRDRGFPIRNRAGVVYRIGGIAADITTQTQAQEQIRRDRESLRALASDLVIAEERACRQLAQDLHDGLGQNLTLVKLKLNALDQAASVSDRKERIGEIISLVHQSGKFVSSMSFELSPPVLHDLGFVPAAEWLAEDLAQRYGLTVEIVDDGSPKPMAERIRVILFRSLRELLINVAKHAQTDLAVVSFLREDSSIAITVEDNGTGFDPCQVERDHGSGFGLFSIGERLKHLGGEMHVRSAPGDGTTITLTTSLGSTE